MLLKKISEEVFHIKKSNNERFTSFNIYCCDESRYGLLALNHKALRVKGVKPICLFEHKFETTYLFGAFSPINGNHLLLELPHCNTENFQLFLNQLSEMQKQELKIIILDNGAFHKSRSLIIPDNIALIFLPPYAPELNPAEKVWWMIKRALKNKWFKTINELLTELTKVINNTINDITIKQLTAFSYYCNAYQCNLNV